MSNSLDPDHYINIKKRTLHISFGLLVIISGLSAHLYYLFFFQLNLVAKFHNQYGLIHGMDEKQYGP